MNVDIFFSLNDINDISDQVIMEKNGNDGLQYAILLGGPMPKSRFPFQFENS